MFYVDINYIDKFEESQHPRGGKGGGKGGQFVKKGEGGGGVAKMPKVNIGKFVESELKKGTSLSDLAQKLKGATSEHTNQQYILKIYGQLEKKHNLPKGSLKSGYGSYSKPSAPAAKPTPAPPPPAPTPTAPPTPPIDNQNWFNPSVSFIVNMDNVINSTVDPLTKAARIRLIAKKLAGPNTFKYANTMLTDLEMKHGVPKGTYAPPGWETGGAPPPSGLKNVDPADLPTPHATSAHQQALHAIASNVNMPPAEKIKAIIEYPTVQNYPTGYAAQYAKQLVEAMGGTMPGPPTPTPMPTPTPTPAAPKPPPAQGKVYKRTTLTKKYQEYHKTFDAAKPSPSNSWNQKEAEKHFTSAADDEFKKYSAAQKKVIAEYTGPHSGSINTACREPPESISPSLLNQIKTLSGAFDEDQSTTKELVKVWRGVDHSATELKKWKNYLSNDMKSTAKLDGFSSCSFYNDHPAFAQRPVWYEIAVQPSTKSIAVAKGSGHHEGEILLDNMQTVEILEIHEDVYVPGHGKKTIVKMITHPSV